MRLAEFHYYLQTKAQNFQLCTEWGRFIFTGIILMYFISKADKDSQAKSAAKSSGRGFRVPFDGLVV